MFEGLVERLLLRLIGDYVEDLNRDQLHVSVWQGDVKLSNLKLKQGALDEFRLPIDVYDGCIESLHVNIPWSKLGSQPVQVHINGIYVLAKPNATNTDVNNNNQTTAAALQRLATVLKQRQLNTYEQNKKQLQDNENDNVDGDSTSNTGNNQSFSGRLMSRVWANVQLSIRNVHIRYEDNVTLQPNRSFAAGIQIHELKAVTTDSTGNAKWVEPDINSLETHKRVSMVGGAVYWNSFSENTMWHLLDKSHDRLNKLATHNTSSNISPRHKPVSTDNDAFHYIIHPLSATVRVILRHDTQQCIQHSLAKSELSLQLNDFQLHLRQHQYNDLSKVLNFLSQIQQQQQLAAVMSRLPPFPTRKHTKPQQWCKLYWRHAAHNVIALRTRKLRFDWNSVKQHSSDRQQYVALWLRHLHTQHNDVLQTTDTAAATSDQSVWLPLADTDRTQLQLLEQRLSIESIVMFRTQAEQQYKLQAKHLDILKQQRQRNAQFRTDHNTTATNTAVQQSGWLASLSKLVTGTQTQVQDTGIDSEWIAALDALQLSNEQQRQIYEQEIVLPATFVTLRIKLQLQNASFILSKLDNNKDIQLSSLIWSGEFSMDRRPSSWSSVSDVQQLRIVDLYKQQSVYDDILSFDTDSNTNTTIAQLCIDDRPSEIDNTCKADMRIKLHAAPCIIVLTQPFIESLMRFFHQSNTAQLLARAQQWQNDAKNTFITALSNHRALDLNMDVQQVTFVFPTNANTIDKPVMLATVDQLKLHSDVGDDSNNIENMELYDAFSLQLKNMQLTTCTSWRHYNNINDRDKHIISVVNGGSDTQSQLNNFIPIQAEHGFDLQLSLYTGKAKSIAAHTAHLLDMHANDNELIHLPPKLLLYGKLSRLHIATCSATSRTIKAVRKQLAHLMTLSYDDSVIDVKLASNANSDTLLSSTALQLEQQSDDTEQLPSSVARRHSIGRRSSVDQSKPSNDSVTVESRIQPRIKLQLTVAIDDVRIDVLNDRSQASVDKQQLMLSMRIGQLSAHINQTISTMYGTLTLGTLTALDLLQPNAPPSPFAFFATSEQLPSLTHQPHKHERWDIQPRQHSEVQLIHITFTRQLKIRNKLVQTEHKPNTVIDMQFNTLHVNWNPHTIAQLLSWLRSTPDVTPASPSVQQIKQTTTVPNTSINTTPTTTRVTMTLKRLSISFNKELEQRHVAGLLMANCSIQHTHYTYSNCSTFSTCGQLGDVRLIDLATDDTLYYDIFRLHDNVQQNSTTHVLDFTFNNYQPSTTLPALNTDKMLLDGMLSNMNAYCDTELFLHVNSVRLVYLQYPMFEWIDYFNEGILSAISNKVKQLVESQLNNAAESKYHKLNITFQNPVLSLPRTMTSKQLLEADLGTISIVNAVIEQRLHIALSILGAQFNTASLVSKLTSELSIEQQRWLPNDMIEQIVYPTSATITTTQLFEPMLQFDTDVKLILPEPVFKRQPNVKSYYDCTIDIGCNKLRGCMSFQQYILLLQVWEENIKVPPPPVQQVTNNNNSAVVYHVYDERIPLSFHVLIAIKHGSLQLLLGCGIVEDDTSMDDMILLEQQQIDALTTIKIDMFKYHMTRTVAGDMQSKISMQSMICIDDRISTQSMPHKYMLTSFAKLTEHLQHNDSASNQALSTSIDKVSTEIEFIWVDTAATGRRDMTFKVNNPCGYIVPSYWLECWSYLTGGIDIAWGEKQQREEQQRQIEMHLNHKYVPNTVFRSFDLHLIGCQLILPTDLQLQNAQCIVLSGDIMMQYSSTIPHLKYNITKPTDWWQSHSFKRNLTINDLRAFVSTCDRPYIEASHSVVTPCQFGWNVAQRTERRYTMNEADYSNNQLIQQVKNSIEQSLYLHSSGRESKVEVRAGVRDVLLVFAVLDTLKGAAITPGVQATRPTTATSSSAANKIPERFESSTVHNITWSPISAVFINDISGYYVPLLNVRLQSSKAIVVSKNNELDNMTANRMSRQSSDKTIQKSEPLNKQVRLSQAADTSTGLVHTSQVNDDDIQLISVDDLGDEGHDTGTQVVRMYTFSTDVAMDVLYLNDKNVVWEPLLESTVYNLRVQYESPNFKYAIDAPSNQSAEPAAAIPETFVSCTTLQPLNFNVTHSFVQTMYTTLSAYQNFQANSSQQREVFAPYIVVNKTCTDVTLKCKYATQRNKAVDKDKTSLLLHNNSIRKLDIRYLATLDAGNTDDVYSRILSSAEPLEFDIQIDTDWSSTESIKVNTIGTSPYLVQKHTEKHVNGTTKNDSPSNKSNMETRQLLLVDVTMSNGSKVITLRSPVELVNRTQHPLLYVLHSTSQMVTDDALHKHLQSHFASDKPTYGTVHTLNAEQSLCLLGIVEPASSISIPMHLLHLQYISAYPANWHADIKWTATDVVLSHRKCLNAVHAVRSGRVRATDVQLQYIQTCSNTAQADKQCVLHIQCVNAISGGFYSDYQYNNTTQHDVQQPPALMMIYDAPVQITNLFPYPLHYKVTYTKSISESSDNTVIDKHELHTTGRIDTGETIWLDNVLLSRKPALEYAVEQYGYTQQIMLHKLNGKREVNLRDSVVPDLQLSTNEQHLPLHIQRYKYNVLNEHSVGTAITQLQSKRIGDVGGALQIQLYTQYWLCNRTSLDLIIYGIHTDDTKSKRILPGQTRDIEVEYYENQRFNIQKKQWLPAFLPTDRPPCSDITGQHARNQESFSLPHEYSDELGVADSTVQYKWTSEWLTDYGTANSEYVCDNDGWQYALDFMWQYSAKNSKTDVVRRRRWYRTYNTVDKQHTMTLFTPKLSGEIYERITATIQPSQAHMNILHVNTDSNTRKHYSHYKILKQRSTYCTPIDLSKRNDGVVVVKQVQTIQLIPNPGTTTQSSDPVIYERSNRYDIGIQYQQATIPFNKSIVASFTPRYILINRLSSTLLVCQSTYQIPDKRRHITTIPSNTYAPFYMYDIVDIPNTKTVHTACIALQSTQHNQHTIHWRWSGQFSIDDIGDVPIMLRNSTGACMFVRVKIHIDQATIYCVFESEQQCKPLYTFKNNLQHTVYIRQKLPYINENTREQVIDTLPKHETVDGVQQQVVADTACQWIELKPNDTSLFAWQEALIGKPNAVQMIIKFVNSDNEVQYIFCYDLVIDNIGVALLDNATHTYADIHVNNGVKLIDIVQTKSRIKQSNKTTIVNQTEQTVEKLQMLFNLSIMKLYVSLIDHTPRELALVTLTDINLAHTSSNIYTKFELRVLDMQLDDQLNDAMFDVVLYRTPDLTQHNNTNKQIVSRPTQPLVLATIIKLAKSTAIEHYKYIGVVIQELELKIDQPFVMAFIPLFSRTNTNNSISQQCTKEHNDIFQLECDILTPLYVKSSEIKQLICSQVNQRTTTLTSSAGSDSDSDENTKYSVIDYNHNIDECNAVALYPFVAVTVYRLEQRYQQSQSQVLYIEQLVLNNIAFGLTFFSLPSSTLSTGSGYSLFGYGTLSSLISTMMLSVANIENARLELGGRNIVHAMATRTALMDILITVYRRQLLSQMYEVLGSSAALGNPIGLLSNIGTGVFDLFNEPATALMEMKSASDIGIGIATGVTSLFKNTLYGVANTASSITGTIGNAAASVTLDPNYMYDRTRSRIKQPKHVAGGLLTGGLNLGKGVFDGITGLVRSPAEGAYNNGVEGFFKGVGLGMIGLVAKPVAGTFDAVASLTDGIKNTTTLFDKSMKPKSIRPARIFYNHVLVAHNAQQLTASYFLTTDGHMNMSRFVTEHYKSHVAMTLHSKRTLDTATIESQVGYAIDHELDDNYILQTQLPGGVSKYDTQYTYYAIAYIITDQSLIYVRLNANTRKANLVWSTRWTHVSRIERHNTSNTVLVVLKDTHNTAQAGVTYPLHCATDELADELEKILVSAHSIAFHTQPTTTTNK